MPASDAEVLSYWRKSSNIDYFTHFIKAWISFNALMRLRNPDAGNDRELLESLKENGVNIIRYFNSRVVENSPEGQIFRNNLGQLQYWLESASIKTEDESNVISYRLIRLKEPITQPIKLSVNSVLYKVVRNNNTHTSEVIYKSVKILYKVQDKYDLPELQTHPEYTRLTQSRKSALESCYTKFDPNKVTSLILQSGGIETTAFRFDNTNDRLYKGTLEILYSLRCALFHGRIVPRGNEEKVYEYAYYILRAILDAQ